MSSNPPPVATDGATARLARRFGDRSVAVYLTVVSGLVLAALHWRLLIPQPIAYADLGYTFVSGGFGFQLSQPYPFTAVTTHVVASQLGSQFGIVTNSLGVFSYALLPAAIYPFLRILGNSKATSSLGAMLYLLNPITLFLSPIYLSWSLVLAAIPLLAALLVLYYRRSRPIYLYLAAVGVATLVLLDPVMGGVESLRELIPASGAIVIGSFLSAPSSRWRRMALDYVCASAVLLVLVLPAVLVFYNQYAFFVQEPSVSATAFNSFHLANVHYTYQGQGVFASISGVISYPGNPASLIGYEGTAAYPVWVLIVLSTYLLPVVSRRSASRLYLALLFTTVVLSAIEFVVYRGLITQLFSRFSVLYLYEYPEFLSAILAFTIISTFTCVLEAGGRLLRFLFATTPIPRVHTVRLGDLQYVVGIRRYPMPPPRRKPRWLDDSRRRALIPVAAFSCAVVLILVPGIPPEIAYATGNPALPPSASDGLPSFYLGLESKLLLSPTVYRVLPLPLTYTTYIDLRAVIPSINIFGIPYAGAVNTLPGTYPNLTAVSDVLTLIASRSVGALPSLLSQSNVKFILVTNLDSTSAPELSLSPYEAYLDGGGATFLSILRGSPGLSVVYMGSDYALLSVKGYLSPVSQVHEVVSLSPTTTSASSISTPIGEDSDFRNGTADWGQWSSCPGPQSDWISYDAGGVNLSTCAAQKGGSPAQTEVYQRVPVLPTEDISIAGTLGSVSNQTITLILIFHNASNSGTFYSAEQEFPQVPHQSGSTFNISIRAPGDSEYMWFGIQVLNSLALPESTQVQSLNLVEIHSETSGVLSYDTAAIPYLANDSVVFESSSLPDDLLAFASSATLINQGVNLSFSNPRNWTFDQVNDSLFLNNVTAVGVIACVTGREVSVFGSILENRGDSRISLGGFVLPTNSVSPGWFEVSDTCGPAQSSMNLTIVSSNLLTITGLGSVVEAAIAATGSATQSISQGKIVVSGSGTVFLSTIEVPEVSSAQGTTVTVASSSGGAWLIVATLGSSGSVVIALPHFVYENTTSIVLNLTSMILDSIAIISVALAWLRPGTLTKIRRGLTRRL
jgi:hypothetical protein